MPRSRKKKNLAMTSVGTSAHEHLEQTLVAFRKQGYCSSCYALAWHSLTRVNSIARFVYRCENCDELTVQCRFCKHFAKAGHQLCAEHDGTIASFERLTMQLEDVTDFAKIFERKTINFKKVASVALYATLSGALLVPAAVVAAPAIGGLVGALVLDLSGAAATSAGLAVLGGGSLAAGGAGMAGGVALIGAVGSAIGGAMGGAVSNSYYRAVKGFAIEKIKDGCEPAVMVIDGFLTEGKEHPNNWLRAISQTYPDNACYYVRWESKTLTKLASLIGGHATSQVATKVIAKWATRASKAAMKRMGPVAMISSAIGLASNPWTLAMVKAQQAGVLLADILARTSSTYILCGHSLGVRVIHYALLDLATRKQPPIIVKAHLLGGAVGNKTEAWREAARAVHGRIINYHSNNDLVLRLIYRAGTLLSSKPVGQHPIEGLHRKIGNVDVSRFVAGHSEYVDAFSTFAKR